MANKESGSKWNVSILDRMVRPKVNMPPAAAQALLDLDFSLEDRERMHELAQKASSGNLTYQEKKESDTYEVAGLFLDLLRLKARLSLSKVKKGT